MYPSLSYLLRVDVRRREGRAMGSLERRVRFHGRGGQGVVTAAQILAAAAHETGAFGLASPWFGPERRGAPVLAYARIAPVPPRDRSQIQAPDLVVVLEENLLEGLDVTSGVPPGGWIVVNSGRRPTSPTFSPRRQPYT